MLCGGPNSGCQRHITDRDATRHKPHEANFVGVSRNLNTTVVRPALLGFKASVMIKPLHVGSRNALLRCEMLDKATGKLLGHGTHDMINPMGLQKENKL